MSCSTLPNIDIDDFQLHFPNTHEPRNLSTAESATSRDERRGLLEGSPAPSADDEILVVTQAVGQLSSVPEAPTPANSGHADAAIFPEEQHSSPEEASAGGVAKAAAS
jgi:hypothetical protein